MKKLSTKPDEHKCPACNGTRVSHRNAASAARPQNLSGPVQELRWQGVDSRDRQPKRGPERVVRTPEIDRHDPLQVRRSINALPTIVDKSHRTLRSSNSRRNLLRIRRRDPISPA